MSKYTYTKSDRLAQQIHQLSVSRGGHGHKLKELLETTSQEGLVGLVNQYSEHRRLVFLNLPIAGKVELVDKVNVHTRRALVSQASDLELLELFEAAPVRIDQKIASVVERSRLDALIPKIIDDQRRDRLLKFANYPNRSVGRITQSEAVVVRPETTVEQALAEVVGFGVVGGTTTHVYVVDSQERFRGMIRTQQLLAMPKSHQVGDLPLIKHPNISPLMSQKRLVKMFLQHDLTEVPVIKDKKFIGRVQVNDVLDVLQQEYAEQMGRFVGVSADEVMETPILASSKRRLPWMVGNIFLDLVAISIILPFEALIAQVTALAVLMPLISDMGGNVGVQAMAVSVRSLTHIKPRLDVFWREIQKELRLGLLNGVILGVVLGVVGWVGWGNFYLGLVSMIALSINTIIASVVGGVLPLVFKRTGRDPAMMSGAVLTTITDFTGFLIFLGLARMFLEYLV